MSFQNRLKRWFKLRFAILYPFAVFLVLFTNSDDESIMRSIWLILAGLSTRIWANGYAIKTEKLTTSGPYAFVRHPLYLGTMLLLIGLIVMLKVYFAGIIAFLIIAIVYYRTIKAEEEILTKKFGDLYINYKKKIPAIIPVIYPYKEGEKWPFSFRRLIQSQEYKLFLWVIFIIIAFHLKDEFLIEHEKIDTKILLLLIAIFIIGMTDLTGEIIKWKRKSN